MSFMSIPEPEPVKRRVRLRRYRFPNWKRTFHELEKAREFAKRHGLMWIEDHGAIGEDGKCPMVLRA